MTTTDHRRLLLLGLLANSDMHGYQLHAHLTDTGLIELKRPAAYNLLETMEQRGWLDHEDEQQGERNRRVYRLTPDGHEALDHLLREQLASDAPPELPNLVSLSLVGLLPPAEARSLLHRRRDHLHDLLESWSGEESEAHAHTGIVGKTLHHVGQVRALELELVDAVIAELTGEDDP